MVIKNRQDILSNIKLLYNYKDSENMDLITAWNPDEDQWWITGFNPECKEKTTPETTPDFIYKK